MHTHRHARTHAHTHTHIYIYGDLLVLTLNTFMIHFSRHSDQ